jgi:hypothetical protein
MWFLIRILVNNVAKFDIYDEKGFKVGMKKVDTKG